MTNKSRKNKQRGGDWPPNLMNPKDRRGVKVVAMHGMRLKFQSNEITGNFEKDFSNDPKQLSNLRKLIEEANSEDQVNLAQKWYFFTPDEVRRTNEEIPDCVTTDRRDFNRYISDLKFLATYFNNEPKVQSKMLQLAHDLCPAANATMGGRKRKLSRSHNLRQRKTLRKRR
jgi:hypothetical protein